MEVRIFAERPLRDFLHERREALRREVQDENRNHLLNVNETEYIAYLVGRFRIESLDFRWEDVTVSDREETIHDSNYPVQVITYHIPFSGKKELLRCVPSSRILWTTDVRLDRNLVCFDIINMQDRAEDVKREAEGILGKIRGQAQSVEQEVQQYNSGLEGFARRVVQERKADLLEQLNLLVALNVPVQKAGDVPATFVVPIVTRRVVVKPDAPNTPFNPEPSLDNSTYNDILGIIHHMGVEMERHPGIYRDKDEEALRDHFLMSLAPHFQSVTGETFNKTGKTDILIRHDKKNVFVAECKFWNGMKAFHRTIDQILGYLTWRDSKAAILCFVQNKELSLVLQQIETKTSSHGCFVKYHGKRAESWFSFEFHLADDHSRAVQLAVLCFHFL